MHASPPKALPVDLLVVGAGLACVRLLQELGQCGFSGRIAVCGAEAALPYNRILLSSLLAGDCTEESLQQHPADWYARHGIQLFTGCRVDVIDVNNRQATLADGRCIHWQQLVLATGSRSAMPAIDGAAAPNVYGFRDLADVGGLQKRARVGGRAVVVGGGLLGLEAAAGLLAQGMAVTLLHRSGWLMNRQLDEAAAGYVQRSLVSRGLVVRLGVSPVALQQHDGRASAVETSDGDFLPADTVVFATGIEPVTGLAKAAGLAVHRGVVVNSRMQSSAGHVYALGECCEFEGHTYGLVAPIWEQARVLANNLCGQVSDYAEKPHITSLKVSGLEVHSMGELVAAPGDRELCFEDRERGIYKKLVLRGCNVAGALLVGDVADSQAIFHWLQNRQPVAADDASRLLLTGDAPVLAAA